jgi:hypothetical protein
LNCRPIEGVVAARLRAEIGGMTPQRNLDFEKCPPSGQMRLDGFGRMREAEGVQILLEPGGGGTPTEFTVQQAELTLRPDLSVARDFSGRLRL